MLNKIRDKPEVLWSCVVMLRSVAL